MKKSTKTPLLFLKHLEQGLHAHFKYAELRVCALTWWLPNCDVLYFP